MAAAMRLRDTLNGVQQTEKSNWDWHGFLKILGLSAFYDTTPPPNKSTPSPTRVHFLHSRPLFPVLSKEVQSQVTNHSDAWVCSGLSNSNHHSYILWVSGIKHEKAKLDKRVGDGEVLNSLRQLKEADISQTPGMFQHGEQLLFISRLFRKSDGPQTERCVLPQSSSYRFLKM